MQISQRFPRRLWLVACGLAVIGVTAAVTRGGSAGAAGPWNPSTSTLPSPPATAETGTPPADIPAYDWSANPLAGFSWGWTTASSLTDASANLPFAVVTERQATPATIYLSAAGTPLGQQLAAVVYAKSPWGRFQIFERASGISQSGIDEWASPGYCTSCSDAGPVTLNNGAHGVLMTTPGSATTIEFLHGDEEIDVMGPPSTFTRQAAITIANDLAAQLR
jgi:hypothetical protein